MANVIIWNPSAKSDSLSYMPDYIAGFYPVRTCGSHQIASWLRINGYSVKVIDFCDVMPIADLVNITKNHIDNSTLVIGISTTFLDFCKKNLYTDAVETNKKKEPEWLIAARQEIEINHPKIKWVSGGKNTWICDTLEWIKFNGDGEDQFLTFVDELFDRKSNATFNVQHIQKQFVKDDFITSYDVLPVELGRGCMFKCKFCSWDQIGKKPGTYIRNFNLIKDEILNHYNQWGVTRFTYVDDTVNESVEKVKLLRDIAKSVPFNLEWIGYLRADLIWAYPDTIKILQDSGLRSAFFGVETFNKSASKLIGKGWSGQHGKEWLLKLKDYWGKDITFELGLIVGLPGQTINELENDIQWLIKNNMYSWWISSLVLNNNGTRKSDFNLNSEKYGFSFPVNENNFYWTNGDWNSKKAFDAYVHLRKLSTGHTELAAFGLSNISSVGYNFKDLMNIKYKDLPKEEIYLKREIYLKNYITKSLQ